MNEPVWTLEKIDRILKSLRENAAAAHEYHNEYNALIDYYLEQRKHLENDRPS